MARFEAPLESAGFANVESFGPIMLGCYLMLVTFFAIVAGELVARLLLVPAPAPPRRTRRHLH